MARFTPPAECGPRFSLVDGEGVMAFELGKRPLEGWSTYVWCSLSLAGQFLRKNILRHSSCHSLLKRKPAEDVPGIRNAMEYLYYWRK